MFQNNQGFASTHTTVGELVEAVTQAALEEAHSPEEGYLLASIAINDLLDRRVED